MEATPHLSPVLITGGCGFLGQHLANDLLLRGFQVVLFDVRQNISLLGRHVRPQNCSVILGDISNPAELVQAITDKRVNSIIHAAAVIPPDSDIRPAHSLKINIQGTCNVLEAARSLNLGRVTFISSGAVYCSSNGPCTEDASIPLDVGYGFYGCAKAAAELIGLKYAKHFNVDFVSARNAAVYGPGVTAPHYLNLFVNNAVRQTKTELDSGGEHRFEFIYVKDAVSGILLVHNTPQLKYRIYNVGTGRTHSLFELADEIKKVLPAAEFSIGPGFREDMLRRGAFDITRLKEIGYEPEYDLQRGLAEFIQSLG